MMEQDMQEILFTREQLTQRIREMAQEITRDYAGKAPIVAGVLRGSFIFMADLVRNIDLPLVLDFISASSYGAGTVSSGLVDIRLDLTEDIKGRDLILVEDILDTGNTLSKLVAELQKREPASIKLCVMLDKPDRRTRPIQADYVGFTIPDAFVVGCGLDYDQRYRQLPYIGVLKPEIYE
jgi:hypoxanthine phosphoribosyltransferase